MHINNENPNRFNKQKTALSEIQQLFFKNLISFETLISIRDVFTENLEIKYQERFEKPRLQNKVRTLTLIKN